MSKEKETRLYKLSKRGQVQEFIVLSRQIEDGAVLITEKGFLEGAYQRDVEPMYPKNVGRSNETSPWQQSLIMHNSKVNKLLDKGYKVLDIDQMSWPDFLKSLEDSHGTDASGDRLPMLAQKDRSKITYPGYIQRKYDGVRCPGKAGTLRSRRGKRFNTLSHIEEVLPVLPSDWELDGEIFHPQRSLQQIVSMVKRDQPANKDLQYRIYDLLAPGIPYNRRKKILEDMNDKALFKGPVSLVKTYRVSNEEEMMDLFDLFLEEGYEGAMWRKPNGLYEFGARSWGLIKLKPFIDQEFEIIGAEEATGRDAGTAIFVLETDKGVQFKARPMGSRELRANYLREIGDLVGEMATVRFQQWTDDGVPFHARVINIRDYEVQG